MASLDANRFYDRVLVALGLVVMIAHAWSAECVSIDSFAINVTEVTIAQFRAFAEATILRLLRR